MSHEIVWMLWVLKSPVRSKPAKRLILDSEQSSGGESTTSEGRKGSFGDQWQTWVFEMLVRNPKQNPKQIQGFQTQFYETQNQWSHEYPGVADSSGDHCAGIGWYWWMLIVYRLYMCEMCPASMTMCQWTHRAIACHNIWRHRHASRRASSTGRGAAPAAIHARTLAHPVSPVPKPAIYPLKLSNTCNVEYLDCGIAETRSLQTSRLLTLVLEKWLHRPHRPIKRKVFMLLGTLYDFGCLGLQTKIKEHLSTTLKLITKDLHHSYNIYIYIYKMKSCNEGLMTHWNGQPAKAR